MQFGTDELFYLDIYKKSELWKQPQDIPGRKDEINHFIGEIEPQLC